MTWALNSRFDTEMAQVICSKHKELHFFHVVRSISNLSILLSVLNFTFLFFAFNCSNMSNSSFYIFLINLWKCFRYLTPYFILFQICKWPISYYYYYYYYYYHYYYLCGKLLMCNSFPMVIFTWNLIKPICYFVTYYMFTLRITWWQNESWFLLFTLRDYSLSVFL